VCLALGALSHGSLAQPLPAAPSAADKETARALMDEGRNKEQAGNLRGALQAYIAADRIMGVPTTALSVGKTQIALGNLVEARDVLLRATRYPTKVGESAPITKARLQAKALADHVATRIPSLKLEVTGAPPGATVTVSIDGEALSAEALGVPRMVNPGKRLITAKAPRYRTARQAVTVRESEQTSVALALTPLPEGASDDEAGEEKTAGTGAKISPVAWVGFGVGGAALVVGIVTGALALSKHSALEESCPSYDCQPSDQSTISSMTALANTSTVGFVLTGAGLVVGLVGLFALSDFGSSEPSTPPAVDVALGLGSVGVRGRF